MRPIEVEALLVPYFKKKIGQKVCWQTRLERFDLPDKTCEFQAEVLAVDGSTVYVYVTSIDLVLSEKQRLGDYQVDLADVNGLGLFWEKLLGFADPQWAKAIRSQGKV